jgi:hypothetical protein
VVGQVEFETTKQSNNSTGAARWGRLSVLFLAGGCFLMTRCFYKIGNCYVDMLIWFVFTERNKRRSGDLSHVSCRFCRHLTDERKLVLIIIIALLVAPPTQTAPHLSWTARTKVF